MQERVKHIIVNNTEYPIVFNLNVMEKIQEEYGTIEAWGELTDGKTKEDGVKQEIDLKAIRFGITEMINEGIDIENENQNNKRGFLTNKQVGRIITELGIEKISDDMHETVIEATQNDNESKNV